MDFSSFPSFSIDALDLLSDKLHKYVCVQCTNKTYKNIDNRQPTIARKYENNFSYHPKNTFPIMFLSVCVVKIIMIRKIFVVFIPFTRRMYLTVSLV